MLNSIFLIFFEYLMKLFNFNKGVFLNYIACKSALLPGHMFKNVGFVTKTDVSSNTFIDDFVRLRPIKSIQNDEECIINFIIFTENAKN